MTDGFYRTAWQRVNTWQVLGVLMIVNAILSFALVSLVLFVVTR